jgi:hypothetical protein
LDDKCSREYLRHAKERIEDTPTPRNTPKQWNQWAQSLTPSPRQALIALPPHQPGKNRKNNAHDQHGRDREEEFESRPVNDDITGQMKKMHLFEPRPE